MKSKSLIIVAVVLGVIVAYLIDSRFSELEEKANPPMSTFFRAAVDIAPGATVQEALGGNPPMLLPVTSIPESFARSYPDAIDEKGELRWARNRRIARPLQAGEFLRLSHLEELSPAELRARLPKGFVATTIAVTAQTSVGFLISPGDRVDVYLVRIEQTPDAEGGSRPVARQVGQKMLVFAVDSDIMHPDGAAARPRGTPYSSVTLADTRKNILAIVEAQLLGELTLVMAARADEEG